MANYNIVVDTSNFRPYDYNLAYRAIQDYNYGYGQSQAVYDKIAQTLGDLKSAVEGSTRAKQIYDAYQNNFDVAADEFSRGMNVNTARKLGELRKIYGTQIRQLERANEARVKAAEYLRAQNKDNDYLHEDIGSLDVWMDDPTRQVRGYSGNRLTTEVAAMMGSVAKSMKQLNTEGRLDPYNKKWIETGGFSPERISEAISQLQTGGIDSVEDPIIKGVLRNVASSSGMDNWADANTLQRRNEYMARGLYGGIGETKVGHFADEEAKKALEFRYEEKKAELQQQRALELLKAKRELELGDALGTYGRSYLDEKDAEGNTKYQKIYNSMQSLVGADGQLKAEYGNAGVNPMTVYEAYNKYAMEHAKTPKLSGTSLYQASHGVHENPDWDGAKKYIKDTYGATSVISKDQYDALKTLGYDDGKAFTIGAHSGKNYVNLGEDYLERLNSLAHRNTTSFASGEKISKLLADRIGRGLSWYRSDNALKEVDGKLEQVDTADWDKVTKDDIVDVGIDIGKEKLIFTTTDGTKYAVDPNIISKEFENMWNSHLQSRDPRLPGKALIENSSLTESQKAQALYGLQEVLLTELMKHVGRGNFQVLSETTSKDD